MNKLVLAGLVTLAALLSACGQGPSVATLSTAGFDAPVVTDSEALASTLDGIDYVGRKGLKELVLEGVGYVGYTPIPDEIKPVPVRWWRFPPICMLIACDRDGNPIPDPRLGYELAKDVTAIYATPQLVERVANYGISPKELSRLDADALQTVMSKGLRVSDSRVGYYLPGSFLERLCQQRPVPRICWFVKGGLNLEDHEKLIPDLDLLVVNYGGLTRLKNAAELVQLRGEGLEPHISTVYAAPPKNVDEGVAGELVTSLYSNETQFTLAKTGLIPVTKEAFSETVPSDLIPHIVGAVSARPTPLPVN